MTTKHPCQILLVEDDELDIVLTREAFVNTGNHLELLIVRDGEEALDFLYHRPPYEAAPRPDLILLDINMPRKDGFEVLAVLKQDKTLAMIPVAVLTTSDAEEDILRSYQLNANCFIRKPIEIDRFTQVMGELKAFWFDAVTLPPSP